MTEPIVIFPNIDELLTTLQNYVADSQHLASDIDQQVSFQSLVDNINHLKKLKELNAKNNHSVDALLDSLIR